MVIKNSSGETIGFHTSDDVRFITNDTFRGMRSMCPTIYHNCKESDKGGCLVIVTRNLDNHIYPKDSTIFF